MPAELRFPEIGDGISTATLAVWLKKVGDRVSVGEPIVQVETDKTTVEVEATVSGILQEILVPAGTDVARNAVLGIIAESAAAEHSSISEAPGLAQPTTAEQTGRPAERTPPADDVLADEGVSATPLARRMAAVAQLDLREIVADADGRITKAHIDRALGRDGAADIATLMPVQPNSPSGSSCAASGRYCDEPLSAARRVAAARLERAKQTIPHFYLQANCRADALAEMRERMNAKVAAGVKITVTDLVVLAAARALRANPAANAAWIGHAIRRYEDVDIAVAVDTPKGLLTPVIRDAAVKSLVQISRELKELSDRARKGHLRPGDYSGGTFTISNLGMFHVTSILPIINPPQACILGIGGIETVGVVRNDALMVGRVMSLTLAADHRVIDGADGAKLLGEIKRLLEEPLALALGI